MGTFLIFPSDGDCNICQNPQTLNLMDEWLKQALPFQQPGESLRYEAWGRVIGNNQKGESCRYRAT